VTAPEFEDRSPFDSGQRLLVNLLVVVPFAILSGGYLAWASAANFFESVLLVLSFSTPAAVGLLLAYRRAVGRSSQEIPGLMGRTALCVSLAPLMLIPGTLEFVGEGGWFEPHRLQSLVIVTLVSAVVAGQVAFHGSRSLLARTAPPADVVDDEARASESVFQDGGRFAGRLRLVITLPAIGGMLILFDLAGLGLRWQSEDQSLKWAEAALSALSESDADLSMSERTRLAWPGEQFRPTRVVALKLSGEGVSGVGMDGVSPQFLALVDAEVASGSTRGVLRPRAGDEVGAFQVMGDGSTLLVGVERDGYLTRLVGTGLLGFGILFTIAVLVFGYAFVVVGDLSSSLRRVTQRASSLARGDLRDVPVVFSDDEMGGLDRLLSEIASSSRTTLLQAEQTAEGVERTIGELSENLGSIVEASSSQSQQVQEVHRLLTAIDGQVAEASRSADSLRTVIDESSNSVLELGAAGDELNETASVLTAKVDAVSDSIEQMVRSVKQVSATTEKLAEASEETSSSMEEMASSMRAVDEVAETTASLSHDAVEKAELGKAKVAQTIAGMEAIREATDAAERVIRGLGDRTSEIGGILDVIDDVADETNLLALNAAIIAAQAGEQGKAFSVVADEIKELADRVLASTKEIGGLIRAVQEESENAIGAIEAGSASVLGGVELSAEAGRTLEEITDVSRESGTRIGEIVHSVREQTKAASHVVGLMERVRESAEEIGAAGAQQDRGNEIVYRSSLTMREVAQQVRRTTEDQTAGFGRIRENVVGVRSEVERITGSLHEQSNACTQVAVYLDSVAADSRSNEVAARKVRDAIGLLSGHALGLRQEVDRFRR